MHPNLRQMLKAFESIDTSGSGRVTIPHFLKTIRSASEEIPDVESLVKQFQCPHAPSLVDYRLFVANLNMLLQGMDVPPSNAAPASTPRPSDTSQGQGNVLEPADDVYETSPSGRLSLSELRRVFEDLDRDRDGVVTYDQLCTYFGSTPEFDACFEAIDSRATGYLTFDQFTLLMEQLSDGGTAQPPTDTTKLAAQAGQILSVCSQYDQRRKGRIRKSELHRLLCVANPILSRCDFLQLTQGHTVPASSPSGDPYVDYIDMIGSLMGPDTTVMSMLSDLTQGDQDSVVGLFPAPLSPQTPPITGPQPPPSPHPPDTVSTSALAALQACHPVPPSPHGPSPSRHASPPQEMSGQRGLDEVAPHRPNFHSLHNTTQKSAQHSPQPHAQYSHRLQQHSPQHQTQQHHQHQHQGQQP
eukprot:Sspe_Gene.76844::Locus_47995_Transcript_1_1_Confidence_1.000_Length_1315::g.76844::m.76844